MGFWQDTISEVKNVPRPVWIIGIPALAGLGLYWYAHKGAAGASAASGQDASASGGVDSQTAPGGIGTVTSGTPTPTPPSPSGGTPPTSTKPPTPAPAPGGSKGTPYTVKQGDTLADIAYNRNYSGGWQAIYAKNAGVLDTTARQHGFANSDNGHWIFPGEVIYL